MSATGHQTLAQKVHQEGELLAGFVETVRSHAGRTLTPLECLEWLQQHLDRRARIAERASAPRTSEAAPAPATAPAPPPVRLGPWLVSRAPAARRASETAPTPAAPPASPRQPPSPPASPRQPPSDVPAPVTPDRVLQTIAQLTRRHDRPPTDDEIGQALGLSYDEVCRRVDELRDQRLAYRLQGVRLTDAGHARLREAAATSTEGAHP